MLITEQTGIIFCKHSSRRQRQCNARIIDTYVEHLRRATVCDSFGEVYQDVRLVVVHYQPQIPTPLSTSVRISDEVVDQLLRRLVARIDHGMQPPRLYPSTALDSYFDHLLMLIWLQDKTQC